MKRKLAFLLLSSLHYRNRNLKAGDRGFTLIEVIVAIVILSVFIVASLSALVAGLNLKLKAKLNNEATLIIQQQLETDRYAATQVGTVTVNGTPTTSSTSSPLALSIPISLFNNKNNFFGAANSSKLSTGSESSAYTLTSTPASATTSNIFVTLDTSKIVAPTTTLGTAITSSTNLTSMTVANASSIKVGDTLLVIGSTNVFTVLVVSISSNTITFAATNTNGSYAVGNKVTILPRSGDTIANIGLCTNGTTTISTTVGGTTTTKTFPASTIGASFISFIGTLPSSTTFNGRTYQTTRLPTAAPDPTSTNALATSTNKVQLFYGVKDTTVSSSDLAFLTTEVIPSVTFLCP